MFNDNLIVGLYVLLFSLLLIDGGCGICVRSICSVVTTIILFVDFCYRRQRR